MSNDIISDIKKLAAQKNATILSHYYQDPEIQDLADFVGDSLELSRFAAKTNADIILFCGVYFMAEVAKILNPTKKVIVPDLNAGCSLADSCRATDFKKFRQLYPDHVAVTYINSSAEVKALSDVICTSSNAVKIVEEISARNNPILFAPDKYLGAYIQKKTGVDMLMWQGTCSVHENFSEKELVQILERLKHKNPIVIAHPECSDSLLNYAHFIGSTSQLIAHTASLPGSTFIVLTEEGIIHKMRSTSPGSEFSSIGTSEGSCGHCSKCPYMRLNTLEKIYDCLSKENNTIELSEDLIEKASIPIEKMMELSIGIGR